MLDQAVQRLFQLDNLQPSPEVNQTFSDLVQAVIDASRHSFAPQDVSRVQQLASAGESELEMFWADQIIMADDPQAVLAGFPYLANYQELVRRETRLVERSGLHLSASSRVCMIGTGPLPLTALELMRQRAVRVDHVDISAAALELCQRVGARLGVECGHIVGSGQDVQLDGHYDLLVVAGLAGQSIADKQAILDNIRPHMADGGRVLLRSARGARELLYPAFAADSFRGVHLREEYHPHDDIINSVFVYEKA